MTALGPIGHLPVDHQRARDGAAGPRVTIPPSGLGYFQRHVQPEPLPLVRDGSTWLFYPEQGGTEGTTAREVCSGCQVRRECLDYAMERPEIFGTWGGTSELVRVRMRNPRNEVA